MSGCQKCGSPTTRRLCAPCERDYRAEQRSGEREPLAPTHDCIDCGETFRATGGMYDEDEPGVWRCWGCIEDGSDDDRAELEASV